MKQEITVKDVLFTPEYAEELLRNGNNENRKISKSMVNKYARAMGRGEWQYHHQGIAVDRNGRIIDGQHRLSAIIESGKSIQMPLITYKSKKTPLGLMIDSGKKRTIADITGIEKYKIEIIKAWIGALYPYKKVESPSIFYAICDEFKNELNEMSSFSSKRIAVVGAAPVKAAVAFLLSQKTDWTKNYSKLLSGETDNTKVNSVREWLFDNAEGMYGMGARRFMFGGAYFLISSKNIIFPESDDIDLTLVDCRNDFEKRIPIIK